MSKHAVLVAAAGAGLAAAGAVAAYSVAASSKIKYVVLFKEGSSNGIRLPSFGCFDTLKAEAEDALHVEQARLFLIQVRSAVGRHESKKGLHDV